MPRVKHISFNGNHYGYSFYCPGCNDIHSIPTKPHEKGWDFDGNEELPTFNPSILVYPHKFLDDDGSIAETPKCHFFVRAGRIEYCGDSTHKLAGQTVDLIEV